MGAVKAAASIAILTAGDRERLTRRAKNRGADDPEDAVSAVQERLLSAPPPPGRDLYPWACRMLDNVVEDARRERRREAKHGDKLALVQSLVSHKRATPPRVVSPAALRAHALRVLVDAVVDAAGGGERELAERSILGMVETCLRGDGLAVGKRREQITIRGSWSRSSTAPTSSAGLGAGRVRAS